MFGHQSRIFNGSTIAYPDAVLNGSATVRPDVPRMDKVLYMPYQKPSPVIIYHTLVLAVLSTTTVSFILAAPLPLLTYNSEPEDVGLFGGCTDLGVGSRRFCVKTGATDLL